MKHEELVNYRKCLTCWNKVSGFDVNELHNKSEIQEFKYCELDPARPLTETNCPEWDSEALKLRAINKAILKVIKGV